MKINRVVNVTKLTKKAIRYYEAKGLISPKVNVTNNYKDYSEKDIENLEIISFLRNLDMAVPMIKEYLFEVENRAIILESHVAKIDMEIKRFQKLKESTKLILEKDNINYHSLNRDFAKKRMVSADYILNQLLTLFPGAFGKYLVVHYGAFLNEPIDTKEKICAFDEIVSYFDNIDEINLSYDILNTLNDIEEDELLRQMIEIKNEVFNKVININLSDSDIIVSLRGQVNSYINNQQENYDFYKDKNKKKVSLIEELKLKGFYDKFAENLKILSKTYGNYLDKAVELNNFLDIEYDENGFIIKH